MNNGFKVCSRCRQNKPISSYQKNRSKVDGVGTYCSTCATEISKEWQSKNTKKGGKYIGWLEYISAYQLRKKYGISPKELDGMIQVQMNKCAICGREPNGKKRLFVDHCHKTGKVRGLLCTNCNLGLGSFKDDIERLKTAIAYLERNK